MVCFKNYLEQENLFMIKTHKQIMFNKDFGYCVGFRHKEIIALKLQLNFTDE